MSQSGFWLDEVVMSSSQREREARTLQALGAAREMSEMLQQQIQNRLQWQNIPELHICTVQGNHSAAQIVQPVDTSVKRGYIGVKQM